LLARELLEARAGIGDRGERRAVAAHEWKYANSDSGSIVPPDLEDTRNSVRCRSICSPTARTVAASVESSTCRAG